MAYEPGQRAYEGYTKAIQSEFGTLNWDELPEYIKNTWIAVEQCCQQPQTVNTRKTFRPFAEKELALGQEVFCIVNNQFCQDINWQNQTERTQFQWVSIARDLRNVFAGHYTSLNDERDKAIQIASKAVELGETATNKAVALERELNQLKSSAITQMVIQFADGCPLTIDPAHIRQITGQYPAGSEQPKPCRNCGHISRHIYGPHEDMCGMDICGCANYMSP